MKKAVDITFAGAIITALLGISVIFTGIFANNELVTKSSLNLLLTSEVLCVAGIVLKLIENRR
jgi:hypothetical protein